MTNSKYRCDEKVFNKKGRYHRCNNILYRYLQSRQCVGVIIIRYLDYLSLIFKNI